MTRDRRLLALLLAALCALAIGACGDDDAEPAASTTTTAATTAAEDPGAFPDKPQILVRFSQRPAGWPAQVREGRSEAGYAGERYRLTAARTALRVALARPIEPATRGVLLETTVRLADGRAGLFCRGSEDGHTGYELTVDRSGHWEITRVEDGFGEPVADGEVGAEAVAGKSGDALLRFICGAAQAGEALSLGFTIGAREVQFVRDEKALALPSASRVGLVVRTGGSKAQASFQYFSASLAE